ncbi:SDR family oxidoreductase [Parasphingorhabdus sp.]|uniref:SDR family oxidoreductase n=1 Tax=Parasphingorhabdus sp. TaxID=2709688 RepID=UPI002F941FF8
MKRSIDRPLALITGGCGGIGMACAREFGRSHDLLLADMSADRLAEFERQLRDEGYIIVGSVAGDLTDNSVIGSLMDRIKAHGSLKVLIHTAGISSALADWRTILKTNVLSTRRMLDAIEPHVTMGMVAVVLASIAGHLAPADAEVDAILDTATTDDFLDSMESHLTRLAAMTAGNGTSFSYSGLSGPAYGVSKRATIRMAVKRSIGWAEKGARIVSISPGLIWTPMGRFEVDHGEAAAEVLAQTPLKRWGTAMDIAQAARFLTSDMASFITGTDLRIDGGMVPVRMDDKY